MIETHFHNSINLSGPALKEAVAKCKKQEEAIFLIYKNTRSKYSASQITKLMVKAGHQYPLWSNRRGITNLKNRGELTMLSEQRDGDLGRKEHYYQLNFSKYPTPQGKAQQLF